MNQFAIWRDERTGTWEIVLWKDRLAIVVQSGLLTKDKAKQALATWQQREKDRTQ